MQAKPTLIAILAITFAASVAVSQTVQAKRAAAGSDSAVGDTAHFDGFVITAKRPVKAGDKIPVFAIGGDSGSAMSVLSVEAAGGANESGKAEPWFAAFP